MSNDKLFVISLVVLAALSAGVAYGMFKVGVMEEYEKSKMYFAAAVLAFLAFIFLLSMILYAFGPGTLPGASEAPGKVIFDACVKIIPPMVTLIIGFYFGSAHERTMAAQGSASVAPLAVAEVSAPAAASKVENQS
ncbi:MAG: hypothetical protein QM740_07065 [Acidovorax sp.]